ncbi:MAG TPA: hypothetical protein VKR06_12020 [Ktedonosporobacter sp.]|nr:hypothetical protein [Ktedonosporobacter sp.]
MCVELPITWSTCYHPEWDASPEAYLKAQIVKPTRSRRLGRYGDPLSERKGYIGVYNQAGIQGTDGRTRFFLSLFAYGHTLGLSSFATIQELLVVLEAFHRQEER